MAPANTKSRDMNFTNIGEAGRKTGITVKPGQRDSFGMENPSDFFSPADKEPAGPSSSPAKIGSNGRTISTDESMDIVTSELPARILDRASLPPRARSPIKTNLGSPVRRASSVGLSSPAPVQAPINRKLTFGKSGASSVLESSPALPSLLPSVGRSSSVDPPPQSKNITKSNGSSSDKQQQKPKKQSFAHMTEEPLAKKAPVKRGLLSKNPAEPKETFPLSDTDSESEGVGSDGGAVDGDTVMTEAQGDAQGEVEEEKEPLVKKGRKQKKAPPKKAAKATEKGLAHAKANSKAKGKKPMMPESEQELESESAPPVKPTRGKKAKAPEPESASVRPTRGKKAEPRTEPDLTLPKLTRGKKAAAKVPELESGPTPAKPTRGRKAQAIKEAETELEPTPVKPAKWKKTTPKVLVITGTVPGPAPMTKPAPKRRGRKAALPIVGSSTEEERESTPPPNPAIKLRGKGHTKPAEPEPADQEDDQEEPPKKRTKATKENLTTKPSIKPSAKTKGKAPAKLQKTKAVSPELQSQHIKLSPQKPDIAKKGSQRIIKEPPPPPRATSEEPGGVRRSTRAHIAPLAYWKGEKIMYTLTARRKSGGTIALPTISEVIRVESDSEAERNKTEKQRRRPTTTGTKRKRTKLEEESEEDFEEEEWESRIVDGEIGVVRGYVKTYHEPPIKETPGEEELEERELAFSRNRIVTVEVANGDFTFVKTCTEDFFGTGMVEIPPGGIKRTKNSGKMHLVFYVISGKVEVKIGDNEFRVRKGAQFMIPRGNLYSIENPYDFQAKMFFAQGCEKVVTAENEDDEGMEGR